MVAQAYNSSILEANKKIWNEILFQAFVVAQQCSREHLPIIYMALALVLSNDKMEKEVENYLFN